MIRAWIGFEGFPIHLFNKASFFSIANLVGKPIKIDEPTTNLSRASVARSFVEMDLLKELPARIWIGTGVGKGFWHSTLYEDLPPYYSRCKKVGHDSSNCKKMLLVRYPEKDGVDPIAAGNEHKQHDTPAFSREIRWLLGHLRIKTFRLQQLCFHSLHLPYEFILSLNQLKIW